VPATLRGPAATLRGPATTLRGPATTLRGPATLRGPGRPPGLPPRPWPRPPPLRRPWSLSLHVISSRVRQAQNGSKWGTEWLDRV